MSSINSIVSKTNTELSLQDLDGWFIPLPQSSTGRSAQIFHSVNRNRGFSLNEGQLSTYVPSEFREMCLQNLKNTLFLNFIKPLNEFITAVYSNEVKKAVSLAKKCISNLSAVDPHNQLVFSFHYISFLLKNTYSFRAETYATNFLKKETTCPNEITTAPDYQKIKVAFLTEYVKVLLSNSKLEKAKAIAEEALSYSAEYSKIYKAQLYLSLSFIADQMNDPKGAIDYINQGIPFILTSEMESAYSLQKAELLKKTNESSTLIKNPIPLSNSVAFRSPDGKSESTDSGNDRDSSIESSEEPLAKKRKTSPDIFSRLDN